MLIVSYENKLFCNTRDVMMTTSLLLVPPLRTVQPGSGSGIASTASASSSRNPRHINSPRERDTNEVDFGSRSLALMGFAAGGK